MKRSTILRRLMTISMIFENLYFLLITIIYIFRPQFYLDIMTSVFGMNIAEVPINDPNMTLLITLYGGVILYFILWFVLKIIMDKDVNPLVVGIITFLFIPVSQVVYTVVYNTTLVGYTGDGSDAIIFHTFNFKVMQYCGWLNIGALILMLMAYAVCRQRFADLD